MAERRIKPLIFNDQTIYVEVADVAQEGDVVGGEYEKTSTGEELTNAGERMRSTIAALAETVHQALSKAQPAEWTLEINIGFKGKAGIPFITEGETNGAVKLSAKWIGK